MKALYFIFLAILFSSNSQAQDLSFKTVELEKKEVLVKTIEGKDTELGPKTVKAIGEIFESVSEKDRDLLETFFTQTVSIKDSTFKIVVGFMLKGKIAKIPEGLSSHDVAAGKYFQAKGKGSYSTSWKLYQKFISEVKKRKLKTEGFLFELQLDDPNEVKAPNQAFEFYVKLK